MLIYLKDDRGYTATIKILNTSAEYTISFDNDHTLEERRVITSEADKRYALVSTVLKRLLEQGFTLVEIVGDKPMRVRSSIVYGRSDSIPVGFNNDGDYIGY